MSLEKGESLKTSFYRFFDRGELPIKKGIMLQLIEHSQGDGIILSDQVLHIGFNPSWEKETIDTLQNMATDLDIELLNWIVIVEDYSFEYEWVVGTDKPNLWLRSEKFRIIADEDPLKNITHHLQSSLNEITVVQIKRRFNNRKFKQQREETDKKELELSEILNLSSQPADSKPKKTSKLNNKENVDKKKNANDSELTSTKVEDKNRQENWIEFSGEKGKSDTNHGVICENFDEFVNKCKKEV